MRKEAGLESDCKIDATCKAWTPLGLEFVFYTGHTEKKKKSVIDNNNILSLPLYW